MSAERPPFLAYYGDDFTGSTDALEFLTRAGLKTVLFTSVPTATQLARFPGVQAIGVAGMTRALAPDEMNTELRLAFAALRELGPRHVHYKVCSTFDSSPTVGSIGRAIDVGAEVFGARFVPLVVGAPALGRYCVFGNLFARMGIGTNGEIHRIDRHPVMSRHPVTPMGEGDLRRHLAKQTRKRIGLVDVLQLGGGVGSAKSALDEQLKNGAEIVLFDVLEASHLETIGAVIDAEATVERPLLSVGSSALEMALGTVGRGFSPPLGAEMGGLETRPTAQPLLVVSGSCSAVTASQIDWAVANGFAGVELRSDGANRSEAMKTAHAALVRGKSAVIFTSRGLVDPTPRPAKELGTMLGEIARELVEHAVVKRLLVAGGDTSSYAARALGIEAVEMVAPLAPGAPLCRAHAPGAAADGLEVNFKGGQVGAADYFGLVASALAADRSGASADPTNVSRT